MLKKNKVAQIQVQSKMVQTKLNKLRTDEGHFQGESLTFL